MKQMTRRWNRTRAGGTRPRTEEPSSHCWDYFARAGRPGSCRAGRVLWRELLWSREEATGHELPATCAYWWSGLGFGATAGYDREHGQLGARPKIRRDDATAPENN